MGDAIRGLAASSLIEAPAASRAEAAGAQVARGELFAASGGGGQVTFAQFKRARFVRELARSVR